MFATLLLVTFLVALAVSTATALVFARSIKGILNRIIADEISAAWFRYLNFAILVVGVSAGVRIYALERYAKYAGHPFRRAAHGEPVRG